MSFLIDIVNFAGTFYCYLLAARLLLQIAQADFYNPISQMIVRFTGPLVHPLQKMVPHMGRFNTAAFLVLIVIQVAMTALEFLANSVAMNFLALIVIGAFRAIESAVYVYLFSFFIIFVTSWVAPGSSHPGITLVYQIAEPLLRPVRNLIPPLGGLDFSIMIAGFGLWMINKHLLAPLFMGLLGAVQ